jgi:hypothetical protein
MIVGGIAFLASGWFAGREFESHRSAWMILASLVLLGLGVWFLDSAWNRFAKQRAEDEAKRRQLLSPEQLQAEDAFVVRNALLDAEIRLSSLAQRVHDDDRASLDDARNAVSAIRQAFETLLPF